jgi:succinoglycan biosynthesis transport protein ExoP
MDIDDTSTPHITDYLRPLWSRRSLILIAVSVATSGVYGFYAQKPKVYSASTLVFVKDPGDPVTGIPSAQGTDRSVQNQAAMLYSRDVATTVSQKIHYLGTPDELLKRVSVTSREGEDFVNVLAKGRSGQEAATIANAYAQQFVALINGSQSSRIKRALDLSQQQNKSLGRGPATAGTRQSLGDQIRRLELALQVPPTITRQVDPAVPPARPSEPKPLRNALFAFILSLVISVGVAFGLERFDRRLKRPLDIVEAYDLPLLAVLPHSDAPAPTRDRAAALSPEFQEAFRVLRTNIELASLDAPPRTIVVSSAMPGEGKSTIVRNLALAFRETGKRVAVVEGDLRHPALAPLFGSPSGGLGLTEVLTDDAQLGDVTVRIAAALPGFEEIDRLSAERRARSAGANGKANRKSNGRSATRVKADSHDLHGGAVTLLLSGAKPANPPAVLASARAEQVLNDLRGSHDIVLIDSAPLLAVTDTVPLLRYADAAVFVGRLGFTTRETAARLREFLARIPDVDVLGVVANDLSQFEAGGFGYGYGYGYGEGEGDKPAGKSRNPVARIRKPAARTRQAV